jgi:NADH:ubiquinone oxidoreductase subunit 3 (subunit A)
MALIFLVLETALVCLFPCVVVLGDMLRHGDQAIFALLAFLGILLTGSICAWRKGVLDWD